MEYHYQTRGVCSREIILVIKDDIIEDVKIIGGCAGNTAGICKLVKGMSIDEVIEKLKGILCGNKGTSCPDQLARALEKYKEEQAKQGLSNQ